MPEAPTATAPPPFREVLSNGTMRLNMHPGQLRAWDSVAQFIAVLSGTQGGKTVFGPPWMDREIDNRGPGDYLVGTSTFKLLDRKLLPEYRLHFEQYLRQAKWFENKAALIFNREIKERGEMVRFPDANEPTQIFFGSAQNPESLESATVKGIHLDEAGQKQFKRDSWDAVLRRGMIFQARTLITTTLYGLGWLKSQIYDPWLNGEDDDIEVIQFDSILNPAFPRESWERALRTLPQWKIDLFMRGRFSKPAGMIYDPFDSDSDVIAPFAIPDNWLRFTCHDFGSVNFVTLWLAQHPSTGDLFIYREMKGGKASSHERAQEIKQLSQGEAFMKSVGGAHAEEGERSDMTQAGWKITEPIGPRQVEGGIQKVYGWFSLHKLKVFKTCPLVIDEIQSYSREVDEEGEPTDVIADKAAYHFMDALRALLGEFDAWAAGRPKSTSLPVTSRM